MKQELLNSSSGTSTPGIYKWNSAFIFSALQLKRANVKRIFLATIFLAGINSTIFAQVTCPARDAGAGADVSGVGTVTWTSPGNVLANDNAYATIALSGSTSHYLQATNYGFTIPPEATITGITVLIGRFGTTGGGSDVRDANVQLIKGGVVGGTNLAATGTDWPSSEGTASYGSTSNLWGTTWTPANINASNFGVALAASSSGSRTASVDFIEIQVTYTGTYKSQFISMSTGSSTWCPGETRTVSVTVKNNGTLTWTTGWPAINIGIKWNTNGTSWDDYHVRTSAANLAPGATATFPFIIEARNSVIGTGYTTPLSAGSNNLTFDAVYEGVSWFGDNAGGVGTGNIKLTSPAQTIAAAPIDKVVAALSSSVCTGGSTSITVASSLATTTYQLRNNSDNSVIGSPVTGNGGTINLSTGSLTSTTTFNVLATLTSSGCTTLMSVTPTVTVNTIPTITSTGAVSSLCSSTGAQTSSLAYTATTNSPTSYSINWVSGISNQGSTAFAFASGGGTINNIAVQANAPAGSFTGTMTVTNAGGCTATQAVSITINQSPTVTPGGPNTVTQSCTPVAIPLTGASVGGAATTGAWSITSGGGTLSSTAQTATPATVTYTPAANFVGNVTLTLTSNTTTVCPVTSGTRTITVNAPTPTIVNYDFNSGASFAALLSNAATGITSTPSGSTTFATGAGNASGANAFTSNATAGNALQSTASQSWTFTLTGAALSRYQTFKVYYQAVRSANSPTITVAYSLNNGAFTSTGITASVGANPLTLGTSFTEALLTMPVGADKPATSLAFRLTASSSTSTNRLDNFQVQAVYDPPADITPTAQASTICTGTSTNIQIANSEVGVNYQLRNNSDNSTIGSAVAGTGGTINLPTGSLSSATTFNVLASDGTGCSLQMVNTVTVTVNPLPTATMPAAACAGSTITISGTNFTTGATNTVAFTGGSATSTIATTATSLVVVIPVAATTGAVTITNGNGCIVTTASYTVNAIPGAPTGPATQTFCSGNSPVVDNLTAAGSNLLWYNASTGGTAYTGSTALVNGTHYYGSQNNAGCESTSRLDVTAVITTTPGAPTGSATQIFCTGNSPTIANIVTDQGTTANGIKWYDNSFGGVAINSATALINDSTYYASQTTSGCEGSARFGVKVTINPTPGAPTATASQSFCAGSNPTIANLATLTGTGIKWYNAASGGTQYTNLATALVNGTIYYASQTVSGCESSARVAVTATVTATPAAPTATTPQVFCSSANPTIANLTTLTGTNIKWYDAAASGTQYTNLATALVNGTIYYASQSTATTPSCESTARVAVTATVNAAPVTTSATICQSGTVIDSLKSSACPNTSGTSGPNFTGTGADNSGTGTQTWSSPTNITSDNGSVASISISSGGTFTSTTHYLFATNFGFAVPANATINGIQVAINRYETTTNSNSSVEDNIVSLIKAGAVTGNDNSVVGVWSTTTSTVINYGTISDLWGTTWTPAQVNASNFGVALSATIVRSSSQTITANVDYVQITVTYTVNGVVNWYTANSGGSSIFSGSPFNPVGVAGSGLTNTNTAGTTPYYAACAAIPDCRAVANFVILATPTATISGTTTICSGDAATITFTGTPNTTVTYNINGAGTPTINLGAGGSNTVSTGSISSNKTYNLVSIGYTSGTGCSHSLSGNAAVTVKPTATASISGNDTICSGTSATVSFSGTPNTRVTYHINSNPKVTVDLNGSGTASVSTGAITSDAVYNLDSVGYISAPACTQIVSGTVTIKVGDFKAPTFSSTPASTSRNTANGVCTYTASGTEFNAVATDNCGVTALTWSLTGATTSASPGTGINSLAGQVFNYGVTNVSWTATDATAHSTTAVSFDVTVNDNQNPVISGCPSNITVNNTPGDCSASVTWTAPTADDNCGIQSFTSTHNSGDIFPVGTTTVTYSATDIHARTSTCSFTVTVIDNENPVITGCPSNITLDNAAGACNNVASWIEPAATDNCGIQSFTPNHASGSTFSVGTTTVTYTATDIHGRTSTCSFTVTIIDNENPVITCPADITTTNTTGACGKNVSFTATATDNCSATISYAPASGSFFIVGTTTVTAVATDPAGNTDTCTFTVTVNDNENPVISGCPSNISLNNTAGSCDAVASWTSPTAADNCAVQSFTSTHNSGDTFPVGTTTVTYTATDIHGRTSTCSFTVTVTDNENPVISDCPSNISVNNTPGDCSASVTWTAPTADDNCGIQSFTSTHNSGDIFPVGTTTVTYTATDIHARTSTCSFTVTVIDNENPVITGCPSNITLNNAPGLCSNVASWTAPIPNDNCGIQSFTPNHANGSTFPVGTTTVIYTATDVHGRTATCSFTVTIIDNENPVITCPADITTTNAAGACGKNISFTATATDNCSATISYTPASGSFFIVGTTTVTAVATDPAGNTDTCTFTVTVNDNENPVISGCPSNISLNNTAGSCDAVASWTEPTATDNCAVQSFTSTHNSGDTFPVGTTTVTYTATDIHGRTSTCSFTVTVTDNENPVISDCPSNITVNNTTGDCSASVTWTLPTADDNCGIQSFTSTHNSGDIFPVGTTTVTYTATDVHNRTSTCTFTVTVIDNENPVVTCPANITVDNAAGVCGKNVSFAATATDNCSATIAYVPASGTFFAVGTTTVTATATDPAGNTDVCTFTVTVNDTANPVITGCPSNITLNNTPGSCDAAASWTEPTAADNCGIQSFTTTHNSGDNFPVGTTTVTYTATDVHGNSVNCSFTVTVVDNENPVISGCPSNITLNNATGECQNVASWSEPTADDNCGIQSFTSTHTSGSAFPVGTTTVTYTATDIHGRTSTCSFTVTIIDNENPVITGCPSDITLNNTPGSCNAVASWSLPSADDNCGIQSFAGNHNSGDTFPVGTTTVTYTATDIHGRTSTCSFTVTVNDNEDPAITGCPSNISLNNASGLCGAITNWTAPTASDNCGIQSFTSNYAPGDTFPVGTTTVTYTATDIHGRTSTCSFTVTVTDNEDPSINCPANISQCNPVVSFNATASDNCGIDLVEYSTASGSTFPIGTTTVTVTATDIHGNTSSCSFDVTILSNSSSTNDVTICDGASYTPPGGTAMTVTGTQISHIPNAAGCDSTITTNLTVIPNSSSTTNISICDGASYTPPGGTAMTVTGSQVSHILNAAGCDSAITTNLTVIPNTSSTANISICDGDSYTPPNGSSMTATGTQVTHILNAAGCDSAITTNLTVIPNTSSIANISICDGASYTPPNGTSMTVTGTQVTHIPNAAGCDSTITTNLTVIPNTSSTAEISICDGGSYTPPGGTAMTATGTQVTHVLNAAGCDSTITTNLTVIPNSSSTADISICDGASYTPPGGTAMTITGTQISHIPNAAGCDSAITTNLTVIPNTNSTANISICDGDSYTPPGGTAMTATGTQVSHIPNAAGCDSAITTNLTVIPNTNSTANISICDGDSYTPPNGTAMTATGTQVTHIPNAAGCDSTITTNLTVIPNTNSTADISICDGDSYTPPGGIAMTTAGTQVSHVLNAAGCDSTITTNLTVIPNTSSTADVSICDGASYTPPNGTAMTATGTQVTHVLNAAGCDSTITTNLTVIPNTSSSADISICDGDSYTPPGGTAMTTAGTQVSHVLNAAGCDSAITTNLTVIPNTSSTADISICDGDSYTPPNGTAMTATGTQVTHVLNAAGCDSTITTNLIVIPNTSSTANVSICDGASYTPPNGTAMTVTGTQVTHVLNAAGCDSTITTNLTVIPNTSSTADVSICDGASYTPPNGTAMTATGTQVTHVLNAAGCDSTITTNLTVIPNTSSTADISICDGDSYTPPNGTAMTATGTQVTHVLNSAGCDSTITTNLTVIPNTSSTANISICDGGNYTPPNGTTMTATGSQVTHILNAAGCDSTITTNLTVIPNTSSTANVSICDGASYTPPGGTAMTATGTQVSHILNAAGCDSTITTNLTVIPNTSSTANITINEGDSYTPPGGTAMTAAGTQVTHIPNAAGCDSTITTIVTVNQNTSSTANISICDGDSYTPPGGTAMTATGTQVSHIPNAAGADSTITTNLTVIPNTSSTANVSICDGDSYTPPNGSAMTVTGSQITHIPNAGGCDSTITTNLTVIPNTSSTANVSICDGDSYTPPNGSAMTVTGSQVTHIPNAAGCDSAITTNLTVIPNTSSTADISICDGDSYTPPNGTAMTATGSQVTHILNAAGCDSAITTNLTVIPNTSSTANISICDGGSYTPPNGSSMTATGTQVTHIPNAAGCDSTITTNLTVIPNTSSTANISICDGGNYTPPNGTAMTATGTQVTHIPNAAGCDSTITTNLTVIPNSSSTANISICDGGSYTPPGGTAMTATGTQVSHILNAAGCDSTITTNLTVIPNTSSTANISICAGSSYTPPGGIAMTATGTQVSHILNAAGCDSAITTNLTVIPNSSSTANVSICPGGSYTPPGGTIMTTAGTQVSHIPNAAGCDSAITTNVTLLTVSTNPTGVTSNAPYNEVCNSNSTTLTVQGGTLGSGASWVWYVGGCASGASIGTGSSIVVTPGTTKTYFVRAEGTCGNSLCASRTITVKTSGPAGVIVTVTGPAAGCPGGTGIVRCNAVANTTYYSWSSYPGTLFNGQPGPVQTTDTFVTVTYGPLPTGASGYNVCVYGGNACGVTSNTKCYWIQASVSVPTFDVANSPIACAGDTLIYSVGAQAGASGYTWTITGNATILSGQGTNSISVKFNTGWTTGNLCVYASISCGANSASRCMAISNAPGIPGTMTGPATVCPGSTYTYTVGAAVGAASYNWAAPAGCTVVNNGTSATITFPVGYSSGPVIAAAFSRCGVQSTTRYMTVTTGRPGTPANITGEAYGVCGQQFIYSVPSVAGATGYAWIVPAGATIVNGQNSNSITVSFSAGFTNGNICVNATNTCGSGGQRCTLVKGSPATPVPITGNTGVCAGSISNYSVVAGTGAVTHTWTVPAGSTILSGQGSTSISVLWGSAAGNVGVVAFNGCGNSGSPRTLAVAITCRLSQQEIRMIIPMNAEAYPNPTHGKLNLKFTGISDENYYVRIVDMTGRIMYTETKKGQPGENLREIDLSSFAKGLYLLDIQNSGEKQIIRISVE